MMRIPQRASCLALIVLVLVGAGPPTKTASLTLDGFSYVSFDDQETFLIPSGGTVRFKVGAPLADGSVPISVDPADVSVGPMTLRAGDEQLVFSLADRASGTVRLESDGRYRAELTATVRVALIHPRDGGTAEYTIRFTTEGASAWNLKRTKQVSVSGVRIDPTSRSVQLVGGTTAQAGDYPQPGAAVFAVLSGVLDRIPGQ
jgi:hypothetical protein